MKKVIFLFFFTVQYFVNYSQVPPKPDLEGYVYGFIPSSSSLVKLEKTKSTQKAKTGMSSLEFSYLIEGKKASVRIKHSDNPTFVISIDGGAEIQSLFPLFKAEVKKDSRTAVSQGSKRGKLIGDKNLVQYSVRKVSPGVIELVLDSPLTPGEYFFVSEGSVGLSSGATKIVYAFGVD